MTADAHHRTASDGSPRRRVTELTLGLVPLAVGAGATAWWFDLPAPYLLLALLLYATLAVFLYRRTPPGPHVGLGPANQVTLGRAGLVLALTASLPYAVASTAAGAWWIIAVATVALVMDGVDGQVARRTNSATPFGARFDMELDSLLMLVLAGLVWRSGRVDGWVILLGLPRYVFLAAGALWPWLTAPLPERVRRKAGCVMQGVALLVALGPIIPLPLASAVAATALVLLVSSFLIDVVWLWREAH